MSRKCEICGKGVVYGVQYSHSHRQSKRSFAPNIKRVKAIVNGTPKEFMFVLDAYVQERYNVLYNTKMQLFKQLHFLFYVFIF